MRRVQQLVYCFLLGIKCNLRRTRRDGAYDVCGVEVEITFCRSWWWKTRVSKQEEVGELVDGIDHLHNYNYNYNYKQ